MNTETRNDDLIELGAASTETKGPGGQAIDLPNGQPHAGILND